MLPDAELPVDELPAAPEVLLSGEEGDCVDGELGEDGVVWSGVWLVEGDWVDGLEGEVLSGDWLLEGDCVDGLEGEVAVGGSGVGVGAVVGCCDCGTSPGCVDGWL